MIADLLRPAQRQEAFSITRVAMNLGVVLGPAARRDRPAARGSASAASSFGCRRAAPPWSCCALSASARAGRRRLGARRSRRSAGSSGYGIVLADRRFLLFCAVAALPVFVHRAPSSRSTRCTSPASSASPTARGAWLLALNALVVATVQYPLVRATKWKNRMVLLAASSALLGIGIGGSAFAAGLASLVVLVVIMSLGETLLAPVAAAEVADFAPEAVRGRYMGAWTVVWNGGAALGAGLHGLGDGRDRRARGLRRPARRGPGRGVFLLRAPDWRRHRRPAPGEASLRLDGRPACATGTIWRRGTALSPAPAFSPAPPTL